MKGILQIKGEDKWNTGMLNGVFLETVGSLILQGLCHTLK